jgi:hypothetical protein
MPNLDADFYLCLDEGSGEPRACWFKSRLRDAGRDDCMLVAIDPPVIGQPYGLGGEDIYYLLLASKWQGRTLWPISEWPFPVYVLRPLRKSILHDSEVDHTQMQLIEWGLLHRSYEDAIRSHV